MRPAGIVPAIAFTVGLTLLQPMPVSGKSTGGGKGGTASGAPGNSGAAVMAPGGTKSHPTTMRFGVRQPCDPKGAFVSRGARFGFFGFDPERFPIDQQRFLIVDATPADAEVFLDGRRLGSAGELIARALPLAPGQHAMAILAQGFRPYVAWFIAGPSFPVRIRVALAPE